MSLYWLASLSLPSPRAYGKTVHIIDPDYSWDELIADCHDIPSDLHMVTPQIPLPRAADPWSVSDLCHSQVASMEDYG